MFPSCNSIRLTSNIHRAILQERTCRCIHTTLRLAGSPHGEDPVKNFEDFKWPNRVSTFEQHKMPMDLLNEEYNYPICRDTMGIRWPGYWFKKKFCYVKEMEPELIVPDLEGFELKPYVSYRAEDVLTEPFTAKSLFDSVYADKVRESYQEDGTTKLELSDENINQARLKALQTGSDLFEDYTTDGVRADISFAE